MKRRNKNLKVTTAERSLRVAQVFRWLAERHPRAVVIQKSQAAWGVCEKTISDYITEARKMSRQRAGEQIEQDLEEAVLSMKNLISSAWEDGDHKQTILQVSQELHRLQGLHDHIKARYRDSGSSITPADYAKALGQILGGDEK